MINPDLGFGDGYSDGRIEVEGDLVAFLEAVFRMTPAAGRPSSSCAASWSAGSSGPAPTA